jgi:cell division septation protein DedD
MFTLGVFVGRGTPVVNSDDLSIKSRFIRFLGLMNQTGKPSPQAAATWTDPRKMLESLNYYEDLTQRGGISPESRSHPANALPAQVHQGQMPAAASKAADSSAEMVANDPSKEGAKRASVPKGSGNRQDSAGKPSSPQPDKPQMLESGAGKYTLLVASLKEPDAQAMIEKLRAKGYSPRVESLDLGTSKWSRILLGAFATRQAATEFADEFNRKEHQEALVTNSSN